MDAYMPKTYSIGNHSIPLDGFRLHSLRADGACQAYHDLLSRALIVNQRMVPQLQMDKPVQFDDTTRAFLLRLHHLWHDDSPLSAYCSMRDDVLSQFDQYGARVASLDAVANLVNQHSSNGEERGHERWGRFFQLVKSIDVEGDGPPPTKVQRKRIYNDTFRTRSLAIIAALWSPELVWFYGWHKLSYTHISLMRHCANRYPHFKNDFCARLNAVLFGRHCRAIRQGREKTLNEARLQPSRDLQIGVLEAVGTKDNLYREWTSNNDGAVALDGDGAMLRSLRPFHYSLYLLEFDRNGIIAPRTPRWTTAEGTDHVVSTPSPGYSIETGGVTMTSHGLSLKNVINEEVENFVRVQGSATNSSYKVSVSDQDEIRADTISTTLPIPERCCQFGTSSSTQAHKANPCIDRLQGLPSTARAPPSLITKPVTASSDGLVCSLSGGSIPASCARSAADPGQPNAVSSPCLATQSASPGKCTSPSVLPPAGDSPGIPTSMEDELATRHKKMIRACSRAFTEKALVSTVHGRSLKGPRMFIAGSHMAKIWTSTCDKLPRGTAEDENEADVLYYSCNNFIEKARRGTIFRKPLVIKETFTDSGMHNVDVLQGLIRNTSCKTQAAMRQSVDGEIHNIKVHEALDHINSFAGPPFHCLKIKDLTQAHRPLFTMLSRFRLLETLIARLQDRIGTKPVSPLANLVGRVDFSVLSLTKECPEIPVDAFCGMWLRILQGPLCFMLLPQDYADWACGDSDHAKSRPPEPDVGRLLILEEDDVLVVPPCAKIVCANPLYSQSLMQGGMFWDDLSILETLETLRRMCRSRVANNIAPAQELPFILSELSILVQERLEDFRGDLSPDAFLRAFYEELSAFKDLGCSCSSAECATACPCSQHERHCTMWCVCKSDSCKSSVY